MADVCPTVGVHPTPGVHLTPGVCPTLGPDLGVIVLKGVSTPPPLLAALTLMFVHPLFQPKSSTPAFL